MNNFTGTMMLLKNTKRMSQSAAIRERSEKQATIAVAVKKVMDRQKYYR